jgi:hypothetical protein
MHTAYLWNAQDVQVDGSDLNYPLFLGGFRHIMYKALRHWTISQRSPLIRVFVSSMEGRIVYKHSIYDAIDTSEKRLRMRAYQNVFLEEF